MSFVLVIFAKVKKYIIPSFLCLSFSLAFLNAKISLCNESRGTTVFKNISATSNIFSDYANPGLEIIGQYISNAASQGNKGPQRILGYFPFGTGDVRNPLTFAGYDNNISGLHLVKSYLFHIYPSHNFW